MDEQQPKLAQDDKDVEAHVKLERDEKEDDKPDVEGHFKSHSPKGASPKSA